MSVLLKFPTFKPQVAGGGGGGGEGISNHDKCLPGLYVTADGSIAAMSHASLSS